MHSRLSSKLRSEYNKQIKAHNRSGLLELLELGKVHNYFTCLFYYFIFIFYYFYYFIIWDKFSGIRAT